MQLPGRPLAEYIAGSNARRERSPPVGGEPTQSHIGEQKWGLTPKRALSHKQRSQRQRSRRRRYKRRRPQNPESYGFGDLTYSRLFATPWGTRIKTSRKNPALTKRLWGRS